MPLICCAKGIEEPSKEVEVEVKKKRLHSIYQRAVKAITRVSPMQD